MRLKGEAKAIPWDVPDPREHGAGGRRSRMIRFGMCRDRSRASTEPPACPASRPAGYPGIGIIPALAVDFWMESGALPWLSQCSGNSQLDPPLPPQAKGPHSIPNPKPNLNFIGSG